MSPQVLQGLAFEICSMDADAPLLVGSLQASLERLAERAMLLLAWKMGKGYCYEAFAT